MLGKPKAASNTHASFDKGLNCMKITQMRPYHFMALTSHPNQIICGPYNTKTVSSVLKEQKSVSSELNYFGTEMANCADCEQRIFLVTPPLSYFQNDDRSEICFCQSQSLASKQAAAGPLSRVGQYVQHPLLMMKMKHQHFTCTQAVTPGINVRTSHAQPSHSNDMTRTPEQNGT